MYKIINILLFIGIIHTSIFAETTREDVDKYIDISRGGEIIKNRFKFRYKTYFSKMYGYDIKKADKSMIKKYKTFIFSKKYEDIFYKAFTEMNDNSYYEIMAFYKTALGQKYTKAFRELYDMDMQDELMKMIMDKNATLGLPKKRKLEEEINKVLYSKLYRGLNKNIFAVGDKRAIEKYNLATNTKGEIAKDEKKALYKKFREVFNQMAYIHFSDDELSQILEYAKSYGNIEMYFLYRALNVNIDAFNKDLNTFLKEKVLKEKKSLVIKNK